MFLRGTQCELWRYHYKKKKRPVVLRHEWCGNGLQKTNERVLLFGYYFPGFSKMVKNWEYCHNSHPMKISDKKYHKIGLVCEKWTFVSKQREVNSLVNGFTIMWFSKNFSKTLISVSNLVDSQGEKIILKKTTSIQICRLENLEHKSMKQVSYSGKYSLSASRAHQSHLQFSFVVGDTFCPRILHMYVFNYPKESIPTTKENCRWD